MIESDGFISLYHLPSTVTSTKLMNRIEWEVIIMYSHDENFIPNLLYSIIMIDSDQFNIM